MCLSIHRHSVEKVEESFGITDAMFAEFSGFGQLEYVSYAYNSSHFESKA